MLTYFWVSGLILVFVATNTAGSRPEVSSKISSCFGLTDVEMQSQTAATGLEAYSSNPDTLPSTSQNKSHHT